MLKHTYSTSQSGTLQKSNGNQNYYCDNIDVTTKPSAAVQISSFEDVLYMIKPLGLWQAWVFLLIGVVIFIQSMANLAVVFFQITPTFTCNVPGIDTTSWTLENIRNVSSPADKDGVIDACKVYIGRPYEALLGMNFTDTVGRLNFSENNHSEWHGNETIDVCTDWIYDTSEDMQRTIVTDWDLICDRKFYTEHTQLVYMGGFFVGSFCCGTIADKFGRKLTFITASVMTAVFGIAESYAPTYFIFLIFRFLLALSYITAALANFCLGLEIVTASYRVWVGALAPLPYACGYTCLALVAYLTKDWRSMHLAITAPGLITLFYWWIFPESPRWLLLKGRVKEAEKVLRTAAKINGMELPANVDFDKIAKVVADEQHLAEEKQVLIFHIFKYPVLAFRAVNIFFNWMVNNMVYYGVALNVSSFAGNRFINNAIAGAVEIPAFMLCVPLLAWGRVKSLSLTLILAGISLFIVSWIELDWLKTTCGMFGKFCIAASYEIIYVATTEMYPTVVRTSGLSASSCSGRIGSMMAPYIAGISKLGEKMEWVPMVVFGAFSIAAGLLTLLLPETKGKKLPEHIEDAIALKDEREQKVKSIDVPVSVQQSKF